MADKDYIKADVVPIEEESLDVRRALARDPDTRERTLRKLAEDEDTVVRTYVAMNPSTPDDLIDYLNDGHIARPYAIEVMSCWGNWDWDPKDYLSNVNDDYADYCVILSDDYDCTEADWWTETADTLTDLKEYYDKVEDVESFLAEVHEYYYAEIQEQYLRSIYEIFEQYEEIDEDAVAETVALFRPDLVQEQISGPNGRETAFVIYDPDEINEDELRDWLFGDVYETREYALDLDSIPAGRDVDLWEMYIDYGREMYDYTLLSNTELEEMRSRGHIEDQICKHCGYDPDECEVFGDI